MIVQKIVAIMTDRAPDSLKKDKYVIFEHRHSIRSIQVRLLLIIILILLVFLINGSFLVIFYDC